MLNRATLAIFPAFLLSLFAVERLLAYSLGSYAGTWHLWMTIRPLFRGVANYLDQVTGSVSLQIAAIAVGIGMLILAGRSLSLAMLANYFALAYVVAVVPSTDSSVDGIVVLAFAGPDWHIPSLRFHWMSGWLMFVGTFVCLYGPYIFISRSYPRTTFRHT